MSYITTVTGKHFDPMDPGNHDFNIVDIAHALSLICRGNGHIRFFYSVAQHSIACAEEAVARGYSPEVILGCLLHDASEAYLSDVTRPVKKELPQYLMAEETLRTKENADRLQCLISELEAYYTSDEWKQDFAADEAGLLPKGLKRGVLSEDGIYNLLEEYKEVSE